MYTGKWKINCENIVREATHKKSRVGVGKTPLKPLSKINTFLSKEKIYEKKYEPLRSRGWVPRP